MDKNAQERVLRAYEHVLALPEDQREGYLDREFEGDGELREVVDALVRSKLGGKWKRKNNGRSPDEEPFAPEVRDNDTISFSDFYGSSLPEHYRFVQRLGKGGMGEVVLAEDIRLNRQVAIKFLSKEVTADHERLKRFRYEAQAASALNHPNIVTVHDVGEGNGFNYIVCEYVLGETLSRRIERGRLPAREAVEIAIEVCSALAAAHRSGIIHRDIKPDNIIIRPDGVVKVLDFGLAKSVSGAHEIEIDDEANTYEKVSTIPGMVMGTPQYMSPEQARGRDVDERSDIFSLGVVLYEMIAGKPPFRGKSTVDVILAITSEEPRPLEKVFQNPPEGLVRVLRRALQKDRKDRYESAEAMLADLRTLMGELETPADGMAPTGIMDPKTTAPNTVSSLFGRRLFWEVPLVIVLLFVLALTVYYFLGITGTAVTSGGSLRSERLAKWTPGPGELINAASFSPDGTRIAFGSNVQSGSNRIWWKPAAGGESIEVTKEDFYNQYPVWSPDGEEIAFFSNRTGEPGIWKVPYTGGKPEKVIGGVEPAAALKYWAPSGKIYFRSASDLYFVPLEGGEANAVTSFGKEGVNPQVLEISRDESKIAYSVLEGDAWKLKVMPAAGGEAEVIATSPREIVQAAWGPNGSNVYYSGKVNGIFQVFRASVDGGEPVQISNDNQDSLVEDVSRDGKRILYSSIEESSDLWSVNISTGEEELVAEAVGSEYWANFSANGKSLVYQASELADRPYEGTIEYRPLEGSDGTLTLAEKGFGPVLSHDGGSVAYFFSANGDKEIRKVSVKGGDAIMLADGEIKSLDFMATPYLKVGAHQISWSPSDEMIAFSKRENGVFDIWEVPAGGGAARRITENDNGKDIYCCPEWSRTGDKLVFVSNARRGSFPSRGSNAIWAVEEGTNRQRMLFDTNERLLILGANASGKAAVFVTAPSDTGQPPVPARIRLGAVDLESGKVAELGAIENSFFYNIHISPDGRSLAYVTWDDGTSVIKLRNLESGVEKILLTEKDRKVLISSLEWSPDGTKIVFGRQSRSNLLSMFVE